MGDQLRDELMLLQRHLDTIQKLVNEQAENEGLWSMPVGRLQTIHEAELQQELRKLHKLIEEGE